MNNIINDEKYYEDSFIDLGPVFDSIFKKKYFILFFTTIFATSSIFYSLSLPNIYVTNATLKLSEDSSPSSALSNISSQFGGLASLVGVSVPGGQGASKANYAIELMKSKDFIKHISSFPGITEKVVAVKSFDIASKKIIFDNDLYSPTQGKWVRTPPSGRSLIPSYLEVHKVVMEDLSISASKKTGFITISYTHESPIFAYEFIDLIITQINKITKEKDLAESNSSLEYLYSQLNQVSEKDLKESINKLIEVQLKTNMLANLKEEYLLESIDSVYIPEMKSGPKRSLICILGTFLGFMLSIFYAVVSYFISKK